MRLEAPPRNGHTLGNWQNFSHHRESLQGGRVTVAEQISENIRKYRDELIGTLRFLNETYDKLLVTLAGGALGLSLVFLKDVIEIEDIRMPSLLLAAWCLFIFSLASVLGRLMFGIEAYRHAIKQVDAGTIYRERVGGSYTRVTRTLHVSSVVLLILGLGFIAVFAFINIGDK